MTDRRPAPAGFALRVDDDLQLVLRERWTVPALHALIVANHERLGRFEQWARALPTAQTLDGFTSDSMQHFTAGTAVPMAIRYRGRLAGTLGATIDTSKDIARSGTGSTSSTRATGW